MPESAHEYLASHELLTLATCSSAGVPHAASVFYVSEGASVIFSTSDATQSGKNLGENPHASIAVADVPARAQGWSDARGIQITGSVSRLEGDEAAAASARFRAEYAHLGEINSPFFKITPTEVHYVHNDEPGDEDIVALGVHWIRETVA